MGSISTPLIKYKLSSSSSSLGDAPRCVTHEASILRRKPQNVLLQQCIDFKIQKCWVATRFFMHCERGCAKKQTAISGPAPLHWGALHRLHSERYLNSMLQTQSTQRIVILYTFCWLRQQFCSDYLQRTMHHIPQPTILLPSSPTLCHLHFSFPFHSNWSVINGWISPY